MKGDFTRFTFDPAKHYTRVLKQQGRVDLDADTNEAADIGTWLDRTRALDVIGRSGAPIHSNGFRIQVDGDGRLTAAPGRFYVDGVLCTLEGDAPVLLSEQPDLPGAFDDADPGDGTYLVWLDAWDRHVTYVEDPEIREVALGGPDTTTRTQTVAQVRLRRLGDDEVGDPGDDVACPDPPGPPTGTLEARADPADDPADPCVVPTGGGYRGLENRLYRVEVHDDGRDGGTPTFKWSRDNGAVVLPIAEGGVDGDTVTVRRLGFDDVLTVRPGDWVEVSGEETELSGRTGTLAQVDTDGVDAADLEVTLTGDVSAHSGERALKLRRWDSDGARPIESGWVDLEDGVQVRFDPDATYRAGDYWTIPARTRAGAVLWPDDGGAPAALRPHGIVRHRAALAVARLADGTWTVVRDCRPTFPPLTELDGEGCCCVEVRPGEDVQQALDTVVAAGGGRVALCAGEHRVRGPLLLRGAHDVAVVGVGDATVVRFLGTGPSGLGGLVLEGCRRIAVERLFATADDVPALVSVRPGSGARLSRGIALRNLTLLNLRRSDGETDLSCGVRLGHADGVAIDECRVVAEVGVLSLWGDALPTLDGRSDAPAAAEPGTSGEAALRALRFEDLQPGTTFRVGDGFSEAGVGVSGEAFEWSSGQTTDGGFARAETGGQAGGSGQDLQVNNLNLRFAPPRPYATVRVAFGEFGGNVNLRVNGGQRLNAGALSQLDGRTVDGVRIGVAMGPDGEHGTLRLDAQPGAEIASFTVGGQELWVDDVRFRGPQAIEEPPAEGTGDGVARLSMRRTTVRFDDAGILALRAERWTVEDSDLQPVDDEAGGAVHLPGAPAEGGGASLAAVPSQSYAPVLDALGRLVATPAQQPRGHALVAALWRDSVVRGCTLGGATGATVAWWIRGGARENVVEARRGLTALWLHGADWDENAVAADRAAFAFAGASGARLTHNRARGANGIVTLSSGVALQTWQQMARVAARGYGAGQEPAGPTAAAMRMVEDAADLLGLGDVVDALDAAFADVLRGIPVTAFLGAGLLGLSTTSSTSLPVVGLDVSHNDIACAERCVALEAFIPLGPLRITHNRLHTATGQALRLEAAPLFANGHLAVLFIRLGMAAVRRAVRQARGSWEEGDETERYVPVLDALDAALARWASWMEGGFDLDFRVESNTIRSLRTAIDANLYELAVLGNHVTLEERRDPSVPEIAAGTVTGTVTAGQGGEALPGVQVQVVGSTLAATTGADGRYRLPGVPAGAYTVRAAAGGFASGVTRVTVRPGTTATADVRLRPFASLRGLALATDVGAEHVRWPLSRAAAAASASEAAAVLGALQESEALEPLALVLRDGAHVEAGVYGDVLLAGPLAEPAARRAAADAVAVVGSVTSDAALAASAAALGPALRANDAAAMRSHLPDFLDGVRAYVDGLGILVRGLGARVVGNQVLVPADARPATSALGGIQLSVSQRETEIAYALGVLLLRVLGNPDAPIRDPLLGITETLVQDNEVVGGVGHGISVQGLARQPDVVKGLRIRGNSVRGAAGVGIYGNEHAFLLDLAAEDNRVEGCGTTDGLSRAKGGIVFFNAALCTVSGNRVVNCGRGDDGGRASFGVDLDTVYSLSAVANEVRASGSGPQEGTGTGGGLRLRHVYGGARVHDNAVGFNRGFGLLWSHPVKGEGPAAFPEFLVSALGSYLGGARKESDLLGEDQALVQGNTFTAGDGASHPLVQVDGVRAVIFSGNACRAPLTVLGEITQATRVVVANNTFETLQDGIAFRLHSVGSGAVLGNVGDSPIHLINSPVESGFNVPDAV